MARVAIYIRWSTDDQGDGTTAQVQLEGCRHYVLSQGWEFRPDLVFTDDGYSGGTLDRPAMARLRAAVRAGQIDCVVVLKIDRLSRNVVDTVNLVLREWEGRCHVKSARESIDTSTPAGKMFFYTLVSFAEWERSVIRERTMSGKLKRLQEGKNPGFRPPFGLTTGETPGSFALVEDEAALVRLIFERCLAGHGCRAVAAELNGLGLRFREERPFTARTVAAILENPLYAGRLVYGRRVSNPRQHEGGSRQVRSTAAPLVVAAAGVPAIIEPERFDAVQALRGKGRAATGQRADSSGHLLTGLLRCRCGSALMGIRAPGGGPHAYYVCAGKRRHGPGYCDAGHIRQDTLDQWLTALLVERYAGALPVAAPTADPLRPAREAAARELAVLERELAVVARDYRRERLSHLEYQEHRQAVEAQQREVRERLAALETAAAAHAGEPEALSRTAPPQRWSLLPAADQKRLLRQLVRTLTVYRPPKSNRVEFDLAWTGRR